ncbi:sugar ABC transporter substrate-binding protein [Microbacterium sp.]|uniref:sugar ABC transporter substrate-binding protein n=1 Tax=Microbacterium sp. TaxID=51671 RepID=UPI0035B34CB9
MLRTRKSRRVNGVIAAIAVTTLAVTACASGAAPSSDNGTVGATLLSLQYPFLVTLDDAAKAQAAEEEIGYISLDPRQKTATELTQIEDLITRKVDVIIMIPVDQQTSQAAAKKVNEAGIPLLLVNTSFEDFDGDYVSYVGSDDTSAGVIQGEYLAEQLPDGGKVIYLVGQYGGAGTERRKAGFDSVLADRPDLEVVTELEAHGSRAEGKTIMEDLLQKYGKGEVQAVIAQSDEMAIGAASAIKEAGREDEFTVVMGIDGSADGLAAVEDGSLTATVFQDAVGQGKAAIETAAKIIRGETVPKVVDLPFVLVTKSNVADFQ